MYKPIFTEKITCSEYLIFFYVCNNTVRFVATLIPLRKRNRYEIDKINYKRWEKERQKERKKEDRIELPADAN